MPDCHTGAGHEPPHVLRSSGRLAVLGLCQLAVVALALAAIPATSGAAEAEPDRILQRGGGGARGTVEPPRSGRERSEAPADPASPTPRAAARGDDSQAPDGTGAQVSEAPASAAPDESRAVPPPFSPVTVERSSGRIGVRVWGRRYEFGAGPFPTSITTQGRELLAAPVAMEIGDRPVAWRALEVREERPSQVRLAATGSAAGELAVEADVLVEYDGMVRLDLRVRGSGSIPSLRYELPLRSEHATLHHHHLVYDYQAGATNREAAAQSAGYTPTGTRRYRFVPSFSLSDRDVGIEWWSETNADWHGPQVRTPFVLSRDDVATRLRVEPITAPLALEESEVWADRLALFALPLRPLPADWRSVRFVAAGASAPRFDPAAGVRPVWIPFGKSFHPRWHGLPAARTDLPEHRQLRETLAKRGVAYVPYGKLVATPTLHPEAIRRFEEWSADDVWWTSPLPSDVASVLEFNGMEAKAHHTYAPCMGAQSYLDWILEQNVATLDAEAPDGLYFDHATIARMCRKNPRLRGQRDREIFEYFAVREFFKRVQFELKSRNPEGLLVLHSPGQPRALAAFADYFWTGEQLATIFRRGASLEQVRADPSRYRADYTALPDGYLDAVARPHAGGPWVLIPQIRRTFLTSVDRDQARRDHRALHGWALLHDVPIVLGNTDNDEAEQIFRAVDRFGTLEGATFHPWWSTTAIRAGGGPGLRASLYERQGRGLLVVFNGGKQDQLATIALDLPRLGLPATAEARTLEHPLTPVPITAGTLAAAVPAGDFRLFAIE